jgi:CheY-like chemotaxis protein
LTLKRIESLGLGYAVAEARTGLEALQRLKSKDPVELVLSDIVMPSGMSGYDLARWLASNKPEIKVILCSGYNDGDRRGDTKGAIQDITVLCKPYTREQLACALKNGLAAVHRPEETSKYAPRWHDLRAAFAATPKERLAVESVQAALNAKSRRPSRSRRRPPRQKML